MQIGGIFRRLVLRLSVVGAVAAGASGALAEYKIGPGDVLALTVTGLADLNTRASVDADGKIVLPLIGALPVAGLSLAEITSRIKGTLPNQQLDQRMDDGRSLPVMISPARISLTIAEYRPVYVSGNVSKPGELAYRPGLTIRQAVALAGGFDLARYKLDNPLLQVSELNGEANGLWIEHLKAQATVARLQAELDGKDEISNALVDTASKSLAEDVIAIEQNQLEARNADFRKEQTHLALASRKEGERADILEQQKIKEIEGLQVDAAELQRYEELYKRGTIALPNLALARRTVLASSTRALQTTAALATVEREQREIARRLEKLSDGRRILLLSELQTATVALASAKAKLQAVSTKLRFVGAAKPRLLRGFDDQVTVSVARSVDGRVVSLSPPADSQLHPGDVVEIVIVAPDPFAP